MDSAELASLRGEYVQAGELLTKSLELVRAVGSKHDLAWVQCGLAENCWHRGEFPAAIEHAKASQLLFEELESVKGMAVASHHAGLILTSQDDLAQAVHEYHQSMRLCRRINERFMLARCLAGLGAVAYKRDDIDLAGTLLFVATTELEQRPDQLTSADLSFYREVLNHCRARLGVELCVALEAHVQELPIDRCASEMLGDMP